MQDHEKTKDQLIDELTALRQRVGELEATTARLTGTEKTLKESELKFRTVADFTYDWEYWIAPDGGLIYVSPSCERITGYHRDEFLNNPKLISEIVHPKDRSIVGDHFDVIDTSASHSYEFRIVTSSGEDRWIEHLCQPVFGEDGGWVGRRGSNRDISKRKSAEKALADIEQRFRLLFERHEAVMLLIEPESGSIVDANTAAAKYYGYPLEILCKKRIQDINCLPPDEVFAERQRAKLEERNYFVFPHRLSTGEIRTVEVHSSPIQVHGRSLLFSIVHDITERKCAEDALRESEARFHAFMEHSPLVAFIKDDQGRFVYANQRWLAQFDLIGTRWKGKTTKEIFGSNKDSKLSKTDLRAIEQNQHIEYTVPVANSDGEIRVWWTFKFPIQDAKGKQYVGGAAIDVTDRVRAMEALREREESIRSLIENSPVALAVTLGASQNPHMFNRKFTETFGYTIDDLPDADHWWLRAYPDENYRNTIKSEWTRRAERAIANTAETEPMNARVTCKDGSIRDVEFRLSSIGDKKSDNFYGPHRTNSGGTGKRAPDNRA